MTNARDHPLLLCVAEQDKSGGKRHYERWGDAGANEEKRPFKIFSKLTLANNPSSLKITILTPEQVETNSNSTERSSQIEQN